MRKLPSRWIIFRSSVRFLRAKNTATSSCRVVETIWILLEIPRDIRPVLFGHRFNDCEKKTRDASNRPRNVRRRTVSRGRAFLPFVLAIEKFLSACERRASWKSTYCQDRSFSCFIRAGGCPAVDWRHNPRSLHDTEEQHGSLNGRRNDWQEEKTRRKGLKEEREETDRRTVAKVLNYAVLRYAPTTREKRDDTGRLRRMQMSAWRIGQVGASGVQAEILPF